MTSFTAFRFSPEGTLVNRTEEAVPAAPAPWTSELRRQLQGAVEATLSLPVAGGETAVIEVRVKPSRGGLSRTQLGPAVSWTAYLVSQGAGAKTLLPELQRGVESEAALGSSARSAPALEPPAAGPATCSVSSGDEARLGVIRAIELDLAGVLLTRPRVMPRALSAAHQPEPRTRADAVVEALTTRGAQRLGAIAIVCGLAFWAVKPLVTGRAQITSLLVGRAQGATQFRSWVTIRLDRPPRSGDLTDLKVVIGDRDGHVLGECDWEMIAEEDVKPLGFNEGFELNEMTQADSPPPLHTDIQFRCPFRGQVASGAVIHAALFWAGRELDRYERVLDG